MTETETDTGLDAGARAFAGNEHLRLDCTIRNPVDPRADFDAAPARKTVSFALLRNALMAGAVVSARRATNRMRCRRWVAGRVDRSRSEKRS